MLFRSQLPQHHKNPTFLSQDTPTTPLEPTNSTIRPSIAQKPQKLISLIHQEDHPRDEPTENLFTSLLLDLSPPLFLRVVAASLLMILPPTLTSMNLFFHLIQTLKPLLLLLHVSYPHGQVLMIVDSVLQLLTLSST